MAKWQIETEDGKLFEIETEEGMSEKDVHTEFRRMLATQDISGEKAPLNKAGEYIAEEAVGVGKTAAGLGEAALSLGTGAIASVPSILAGMGRLNPFNILEQQLFDVTPEQQKKGGEAIAKQFTYQPKTEVGQAMSKQLVEPAMKGLDVSLEGAGALLAAPEEIVRGVIDSPWREGVAPRTSQELEEDIQEQNARREEYKNVAALALLVAPLAKGAKESKGPRRGEDAGDFYERKWLEENQGKPPEKFSDYGDLYEKLWLDQFTKEHPQYADTLKSVGAAETLGVKDQLLGRIADKAEDTVHRFTTGVEAPGTRSVSMLHTYGDKSPLLKSIAEDIEAPIRVGAKVTKQDYNTRTHLKYGEYIAEYKKIIEPLRKGFLGRIPRAMKDNIYDALNTPIKERVAKYGTVVADVATKLEILLDKFYKYGEGPVKLHKQKLYVPMVLNRRLLKAGTKARDAFTKLVEKYATKDITAADTIVRGIVDEGGVVPVTSRIPMDQLRNGIPVKGRKVAHEKPRDLLSKIPYEELKPFLLRDIDSVLQKYFGSMIKRVEWARMFGKKGEKLTDIVKRRGGKPSKLDQELMDAGVSFEQRQAIHDRLVALADRLQGVPSVAGKDATFRRASSAIVAYETVRLLHWMTLGAVQEMWAPFARGRFSEAFKSFIKGASTHVPMETMRQFNKKLPKAQMTEAAESAGLALHSSLVDMLTNQLGVGTHNWLKVYFKANMAEPFLRWQVVTAYETGVNTIVADLKQLHNKSGLKVFQRKAEQRLNHLGIDIEKGKQWLDNGADYGDPFYTTDIRGGGVRFTNETVIQPRTATTPLWYTDPKFSLITQFWKWQANFGNTFMKRGYVDMMEAAKKGDPALAAVNATQFGGTLALMVGTTFLLDDTVREWLNYDAWGKKKLKKEKTTGEKLYHAIDRAGMLGAWQIPINIAAGMLMYNKPLINSPFLSHIMDLAKQGNLMIKGKTEDTRSKAKEKIVKSIILPNIPAIQKEEKAQFYR